jgi:hypothetical protein
MQLDPIGLKSGDINFYRYVDNGSVNSLDPFGLCGVEGSGHLYDLARGTAQAYVEWFPGKEKAELVILRNGVKLIRFEWYASNPNVIKTLYLHGGKALAGISESLMRKISLSVTDHLKILIKKAGGKFTRAMIPSVVRRGFPGGAAGTVARLSIIAAIADAIFGSGVGTANAAEVDRGWRMQIPLEDLGLNPDLTPICHPTNPPSFKFDPPPRPTPCCGGIPGAKRCY